jgi:NurA-like 5'-3' nuclease
MYETLAKKKSIIREEIDRLLRIRDIEKYKDLWRSVEFSGEEVKIGGEDGSFNHLKYKNFVLYAVNAIAFSYDGSIKGVEASDINILFPYKNIEERLKLYQTILELKVSQRIIDEVEVFLLDGSLMSKLAAPKELVLTIDEKKEVVDFLPKLEREIALEISSSKYAGMLGKYEKIAFFEYLEFLVVVGKLLEKGLNKIVCVSKTSTWSEFNQGMSDLAVYEELTNKSGYSKPVYRPLGSYYGRFPINEELFESLVFTTFYARLEDNKNTFMFEVPMEIDEEEVYDILNKIKPICVEGYPYLLKKAHRKVVITRKDIHRIFTSLGIHAKTGREML